MIPILFAAAIVVQPAEEPPPADVTEAGQAWTECLANGADSAPERGSAREAVRVVMANCQTLQTRMVEAHGRWVDASPLSADEKRDARAAMLRSLEGVEAQVAAAISGGRER